jgi:hypothetical protein
MVQTMRASLVFVFLAACAEDPPVVGTCDEDLGGCPDGSPKKTPDAEAVDGPLFDVPRDRSSPTDVLSIVLEPANTTLNAEIGTPAMTTFRVMGRQRDGRMREITMYRRFTLDNTSLGTLNPDSGVFTGAGVGGSARVRVALVDGSSLTAETTLTVNVRATFFADGVTPADRMRVMSTMATGAAAQTPLIDYPLSAAVLPQNVYPPLIQWTPRVTSTDATAVVRVRLARPHAVVEAYLRPTVMGFTHSWRPGADLWRSIASSDLAAPITMTVTALADGVLRESEARVFRTADAVIAGSVYYWSPAASRLRRIDVDVARRVDFLPEPGDRCIGCHAVSRDGRQLAGFLEGTGENLGLYDLTRDLTPTPAPIVARVPYMVRRCTSYNPDGSLLVSGDCGANPTTSAFTLINGRNGMPVATTGASLQGFDPEWSPDGRSIAYTNRMDALTLASVAADNRFGEPVVMHTPAAPMPVDWHPSWSPDSSWIAFQRGNQRRTALAMGVGSLWLIQRTGGAPIRMDNASFGTTTEESFRPIFSPFNSGGFFWLLFTTNHPYGNQWAGTRNAKQIWVTAVRNRPAAGSDPSMVPYYLDGQETATALSPYWAPAPCRPNGNACSTGGDCCSGTCDPDSSGRNVCVRPRAMCIARGGRCGGDGDCCTSLVCTNNLCDLPPPM